jgi:hypothetical protein
MTAYSKKDNLNNAESEDEEPLSKVPQKRKENTDCRNMAFD